MLSACSGCGALFPSYAGPTHRYVGASAACWALFNWLMTTGGPDTTGLVGQSRIPDNLIIVPEHSDALLLDALFGDAYGVLYLTQDGGDTWLSKSLGLENPNIMGFASGAFINETPQAAVRFTDADHGLVVLGLSGKSSMIALRTTDGGKTWTEDSLPAESGTPYISHDGRFLTVNQWGKGLTLLKYE